MARVLLVNGRLLGVSMKNAKVVAGLFLASLGGAAAGEPRAEAASRNLDGRTRVVLSHVVARVHQEAPAEISEQTDQSILLAQAGDRELFGPVQLPERRGAYAVAPRTVSAPSADRWLGLDLPEPGPLSAIVATIALAGFFFVRRST